MKILWATDGSEASEAAVPYLRGPLNAAGKPGESIRMRFAERLNPDGTIYTENLRKAEATDTYTCGNSPAASWEPHFTFHGFQYVELTGSAAPPARLRPRRW